MVVDATLSKTRFRAHVEERSGLSPGRIALAGAIAYAILIGLYIWISGGIVARLSDTVEELRTAELIKGILFVFVSSLMIYICMRTYLHKIAQRDTTIIEQHKKLLSSERLVMAGTFASSVCHDVGNMLHVAVGNLEIVRDSGHLDEEEREAVAQLSASLGNLGDITRRMMESGKEFVPGESVEGDLVPILEEALDFAVVHGSVRGCVLERELEGPIVLRRNPVLIGRALMNMVLNAAEATDGRGRILVRVLREQKGAVLEVHDDGPGVPDGLREKIFEAFFTSKTHGNGLGLLSLKSCALHHGGWLALGESRYGGACFRIGLPFTAP